jgi:hypothetical protein
VAWHPQSLSSECKGASALKGMILGVFFLSSADWNEARSIYFYLPVS